MNDIVMQFIGVCSVIQCENYITHHIVFLKAASQ